MNFEVSIFRAHIPATQSFNSFQPKRHCVTGHQRLSCALWHEEGKKKDLFIGTFMPSTELSGA